jgi:DNA-binding response OmpR family regulator
MKDSPVILTVDRNPRNLELLKQFLERAGCEALSVSTLEEFDLILEDPQEIMLAMVDISGFNPEIWKRCERLRDAGIFWLMLTSRQDVGAWKRSVTYGAMGVLVKPLAMQQLMETIQRLAEKRG